MKVLIIHYGYPIGEFTGECVRTMNMAKSLKKLGFTVTVLLLYNVVRFKPHKPIYKDKNGIEIISIPTFPISHLLKLGLIYNQFIVWCISKIRHIDIVQAEVTWSSSITGLIKKLPLVTDFHSDLVPELSFLNKSKSFVEKAKNDNIYALKNSKRIICVSETLHNNLCKTYNVNFEPYILPCNVDFKLFSDKRLSARNELRKQYGIENRIVLSYIGGTHNWQCLNETFDLFLKLHKLDERYFFCLFTQSSLSQFQDKILQIKESFMTMPLNKDNIVEHLSMIDGGFLIRDNMLLNLNSSPTKTSEYMACGAMVITTKYAGDAPELINKCGKGYILNSVRPNEEEIYDLHKYILDYKNNYVTNSKITRECIRNNRLWDYNEDKLQCLYKNILER